MAIENLGRILAAHPFFAPLAAQHLATIVGCAANVTFEQGQLLFRQGAPADRFYVVRHGKVGVEVFAPGRGAMLLETLEEGEIVGWSWLFPPYQAHFDARALSLVRALSLDGTCLRAKCDSDPVLGYALMKRFAPILIQHLDAARVQLMDIYGNGR